MDHRSIKRPRSEPSTTDEPPKPKKKSKKNKKSGKSNVSDKKKDTATSAARKSTATAEGQNMAQVLSTFNRLEQSRFEAFRRCTFRGDAVSAYVSHCLAAANERAFARSEKCRQVMGGSSLGIGGQDAKSTRRLETAMRHCPYVVDKNDNHNRPMPAAAAKPKQQQRPLEDMVAPNQAEEITVVVSTLAKAYAQRLVTAARRVATAEGYSHDKPLLPTHVLQAHQCRVSAGLDPGFFLQQSSVKSGSANNHKIVVGGVSSAAEAAALGVVDRVQLKRNAALAAQEEYDKYVEEQQTANATTTAPQQNQDEDQKVEEATTMEDAPIATATTTTTKTTAPLPEKEDQDQKTGATTTLEDAAMNEMEDE